MARVSRQNDGRGMTQEGFDTLDVLIARYVAGTLPAPLSVLLASHLELCASSRALVRGLEASAGDELETLEPVPLSDRDAMLSAIVDRDRPAAAPFEKPTGDTILPRALHDFVGHTVETIPWKTKIPGFREFEIGDVEGCHATMYWIRGGRKIPSHTHEGFEVTLVLDGAFSDESGHYSRGDIALADPSIDHRPLTDTGRPCICFAVTDAPLRLTGPMHQRIADIIGAG